MLDFADENAQGPENSNEYKHLHRFGSQNYSDNFASQLSRWKTSELMEGKFDTRIDKFINFIHLQVFRYWQEVLKKEKDRVKCISEIEYDEKTGTISFQYKGKPYQIVVQTVSKTTQTLDQIRKMLTTLSNMRNDGKARQIEDREIMLAYGESTESGGNNIGHLIASTKNNATVQLYSTSSHIF